MSPEALAQLIADAIEGDYPEGSVAASVVGNTIRVDLIDNDDEEHAFALTVERRP